MNIFGSYSEEMSKNKNITKSTILKVGMVLAVLLVAVLFDVYHDDSISTQEDKSETQKVPQSHEVGDVIVYGSFNSFKLKTSIGKNISRKLFFRTQPQFLQKYHNLKASQLVKLESLRHYVPSDLVIHLISIQKCLFRNPDDTVDSLS